MRSKSLIGRGRICAYLRIGKEYFYVLVAQGLPVKKLPGGRWGGHMEQLDEWFKGGARDEVPKKTSNDRSIPDDRRAPRKQC